MDTFIQVPPTATRSPLLRAKARMRDKLRVDYIKVMRTFTPHSLQTFLPYLFVPDIKFRTPYRLLCTEMRRLFY